MTTVADIEDGLLEAVERSDIFSIANILKGLNSYNAKCIQPRVFNIVLKCLMREEMPTNYCKFAIFTILYGLGVNSPSIDQDIIQF